MEQEILKVISENLPEQVGKVLKQKLDQADKDKQLISRLQEDLSAIKDQNLWLHEQVQKLKDRINNEMNIEAHRTDLEKRERDMAMKILEIRLEESEKRNSIGERIVEQVFRSPVYRKHVESIQHGSYDAQGRYSITGSTPVNEITSID